MERRELLKIMAMTFGGSFALPESVFAKMGEPFDAAELTFFTPEERSHCAAYAEAIIPETDTPGAIAAGVPGWIEVILKDCYNAGDQKFLKDGLAAIVAACQEQNGKPIDKLAAADQVAFLTAYHDAGGAGKGFLGQFKELVKFTYVNSELGGSKALQFDLVPGKWVASMPLEPGQKAYSM